MFNDIIVWASARACFKLLISFICQTVKVVCVGWLSNSRRWLMKKKKKKKNLLWGWEPQKVRCGWYNGPVMIWDAALGEREKKKTKKNRNTRHKVRLFIHSAELLSTVCYWWKYITYLVLYIAWKKYRKYRMYQGNELSHCFSLFSPPGFLTVCGSRIPMSLTLHTTEIWLNTRTDSGGMKDRTHGIFLQEKSLKCKTQNGNDCSFSST